MPVLNALQRWFSARLPSGFAPTVPENVDATAQRARNQTLWDVLRDVHRTNASETTDRAVRQAVDAGADLNARLPLTFQHAGLYRRRPLSWAIRHQRWDLATWMVEHGAKPGLPTVAGEGWEDKAVDPAGFPRGRPAPDVFILADALVMVSLALTKGLDEAPMWRTVDALLDRGLGSFGPPGASCPAWLCGLDQVIRQQPDLRGWSPGRLQRFDLNDVSPEGRTVLHLAAERAHRTTPLLAGVATLLDAGADPYRQDQQGESPLHVLARLTTTGKLAPQDLVAFSAQRPELDWTWPNAQGVSPQSLVTYPLGAAAPVLASNVRRGASAYFAQHQDALEQRAALEATFDETPPSARTSVSRRGR